ncbi:MAG: biopolymer transporter ExbD [Planctomycetota bacterium]
MRLSRQKFHGSMRFNMTPMIDIVFLLIIFFMTVSQITRTVETPMELPVVTQGDETAQTTTVTVNINQTGEILIGGQEQTLAKAVAVIRMRLEKVGNRPEKVKIQIRAHRLCQCRHLTELFQQLSNLGITNVRSSVSDS